MTNAPHMAAPGGIVISNLTAGMFILGLEPNLARPVHTLTAVLFNKSNMGPRECSFISSQPLSSYKCPRETQ